MPDTSKEAVERVICQPLIDHVADGKTIWGEGYAQMIDLARALVKERDALREENRELKMQAVSDGCETQKGANHGE